MLLNTNVNYYTRIICTYGERRSLYVYVRTFYDTSYKIRKNKKYYIFLTHA